MHVYILARYVLCNVVYDLFVVWKANIKYLVYYW